MKTILKWALRVLAALAVAALVVGIWKREEITRLLAVNSLFSEEKIVDNFSNMQGAFLSVPVARGDAPTSPLPYGPEVEMPAGLDAYVQERSLTSLLVLHDGEIVFENYYQGTGPEDRRISWSVAKSFLSALVGVLLEEGAIASIDDPVTQYAPALKGGAYDGATLRQVLNMASGVTFDEDYMDPDSDINRMGRVLALGGEMDSFAADLDQRFTDPGAEWKYVSIDTHVIGMVVRGATGRSVPDLLGEKIIAPLGLEYAPYYLTDGVGTAFVLGGLNLTTRDYARFGQMYAQGGMWQDRQIVPQDWVAASTTPSAPGGVGYGYQWWIPEGSPPGAYMARGIYGQYIYIDTARQVVVVATSADRAFRQPGAADQNVDMFRQIARKLGETDDT